MKIASIAALVLFLSASVLIAQTQRFTGRVLDPSGAVIPGADLKISQGTTIVREGKTDANGIFAFDLPAGEYRLEVSADAFKVHQQNVRVAPNLRPVTVSLSLAGVNAQVDVAEKDDAVGLEDDANLTSTTISSDRVKDLPADEDALLAQLQQIAGGGGAAGGAAAVVVDGFTNGRVPPRDQIQQIIIDTNVFSAESTGGPRIQIITKPGTGPWSGSLNGNFTDESLNARTPFDLNKPKKQQRIFTTSYGGPVIPGKLSLRFNARTLQQDTQEGSVIAVTPAGTVNTGVFSPVRNQNLGVTGQVFLTRNNTVNFNGNYNSNENLNTGVGGVSLPERAMNFKGHNWSAQFIERAIISTKLTSEVRFSKWHNQNSLLPITEAVGINVLDAFNGGGAQNRTRRRGSSYNFGNTFRWLATPKVNIQTGTDFNYNKNYSSSETNYLGVFTFSSLDDYLAGRPLNFRKTTGDPVVNVNQLEVATFFQADVRLSSKLNLGAGVRYQAQTNLNDHNNLAPTFQIAYQPRTGTVIRAGGRLSYQVFNIGNTETIRRQDGVAHQVETVILNPSYPDPFANDSGTTAANNASIRTSDPNLVAPYNINSAITLEQNLKKGWRFSASVDATRGVHLIRTRNINAPFPGTPLSADLFNRLNSSNPSVQADARNEVDRMRPLYPVTIGNIYQFESAATSLSKNAGLRVYTPNNFAIHRIGINGFVQYTLGWSRDDQSAVNQYDWRSEWGPSSFDTRHRFVSNLSLRLPRTSSLSFLIFANSGRPYSITTGKDNNGDQSTNDRPVGVLRNSATGPGSYNVNMSFTKQFALKKPESAPRGAAAAGPGPNDPVMIIGGPGGPTVISQAPLGGNAPGPKMSFNVNANNLLNNTQLRGYSGVMTSPLFGKPTGAAPGRTIMLGLGFTF